MRIISLVALLLLIGTIGACGPDNQVGSRFTERRVIKNISVHQVTLQLFMNGELNESNIFSGDSVIFSARCEVRGGDIGCVDPDNGGGVLLASEDSTYVVFENDRILKYIRENSDSCFERNILIIGEPCGYEIEGAGTSLRTYTYNITNEDYDNAEPIDG